MKKAIDGNLVKFTFDDGVEPLTFDCTKMSEQARNYAVPFGMCHRLGDMAAIPKSEANGFKVTEAMRREEIAKGIAHYESGAVEWNMKGGPRAPAQNPTILAIAVKMGITYTEAEAEIQRRMLAELGA